MLLNHHACSFRTYVYESSSVVELTYLYMCAIASASTSALPICICALLYMYIYICVCVCVCARVYLQLHVHVHVSLRRNIERTSSNLSRLRDYLYEPLSPTRYLTVRDTYVHRTKETPLQPTFNSIRILYRLTYLCASFLLFYSLLALLLA